MPKGLANGEVLSVKKRSSCPTSPGPGNAARISVYFTIDGGFLFHYQSFTCNIIPGYGIPKLAWEFWCFLNINHPVFYSNIIHERSLVL
jgi:hypothetical protein